MESGLKAKSGLNIVLGIVNLNMKNKAFLKEPKPITLIFDTVNERKAFQRSHLKKIYRNSPSHINF